MNNVLAFIFSFYVCKFLVTGRSFFGGGGTVIGYIILGEG